MPTNVLPSVEIEPKGTARAAVIWLHGLGADGHDFEPIVPYLGIPASLGVRFVFPHAPNRAVSINMGMIMPAWYDIRELGLKHDEDEKGIRESSASVVDLIARENARGIPTKQIVLAGFSQGGAIALHQGLRHEEKLAGILALSTYLVLDKSLEAEISEANRSTPVFVAHGSLDPMVPFQAGEMTTKRLQSLGYPVTWHPYPIGHEVGPQEIRDVGEWLIARLS